MDEPPKPPGKLEDIVLTEKQLRSAKVTALNKANNKFMREWDDWVSEGYSVLTWEPDRLKEPRPNVYNRNGVLIWGDEYDKAYKLAHPDESDDDLNIVTINEEGAADEL